MPRPLTAKTCAEPQSKAEERRGTCRWSSPRLDRIVRVDSFTSALAIVFDVSLANSLDSSGDAPPDRLTPTRSKFGTAAATVEGVP